MSTILLRPISNQIRLWDTSDYSYIDDDVTYPTVDGTADKNTAYKDPNTYEHFNVAAISGIVTALDIYALVSVDHATQTLKLNYTIGDTTGSVQTESIPISGYTWYVKSWSGLSLNASSRNRIIIGCGSMGSGDHLYVAVAYGVYTYTPIDMLNIRRGNLRGGNIR